MLYFHQIEDAQAVLLCNGVYKQVHLYRRGDEVYAKNGAGYVRLLARGDTSAPKVRWVDLDERDGVTKDGGPRSAPHWSHDEPIL